MIVQMQLEPAQVEALKGALTHAVTQFAAKLQHLSFDSDSGVILGHDESYHPLASAAEFALRALCVNIMEQIKEQGDLTLYHMGEAAALIQVLFLARRDLERDIIPTLYCEFEPLTQQLKRAEQRLYSSNRTAEETPDA